MQMLSPVRSHDYFMIHSEEKEPLAAGKYLTVPSRKAPDERQYVRDSPRQDKKYCSQQEQP